MNPGKFAETFRITQGSSFRLKDSDPGETLRLKSKEHAQKLLEKGIARLRDLQEKLGQHDRARDVRREPSGVSGVFIQGSFR